MRVFAISLAISARVAREDLLLFDFFWGILASCHVSEGQEWSIQTSILRNALPRQPVHTPGGQKKFPIRIGRGKELRSVVTTTNPCLRPGDHRAAMASVAGTRVAALNSSSSSRNLAEESLSFFV
jgi:hypothetical protein